MTAPVTLTHAEGEAVAVLEMLLGAPTLAARRVAQHGPRTVDLPDKPRPELVRIAAERLNTGVVRHLVESGGWRTRRVLRRGRRREGRIFDAGMNDGLTLRFGPASLAVWWGVARALPEIVAGRPSRRRRPLRGLYELSARTGDWVFFALADRAVGRMALEPEVASEIAGPLREGSPLAALIALDGSALHRGALDMLLAEGAVRIVECLDDELERGWRAAAARVYQSELDPQRAAAAWTGLSAALSRWLAALDDARRTDLARPLLRFAVWVATDLLADAARVRETVTSLSGVRTVADRARVLEAVATLAGVGLELIALRARLGGERYGDERYEESQLYLADFDALLAPHRTRVEALRNQLGGAIG